jgi:hypothetical protein
VYNPDVTKNKILRYFPFDGDKVELILKHEYLNFKEDWKITQCNVISGLLYFTFGYFNSFLNNDFNPPRKINLEKAKKFTDKLTDAWGFTGISKVIDGLFEWTMYTGTKTSGYNNFQQGDHVVCWVNEGDAYGYRFKPATGFCHVKYVYNNLPNNQFAIVTDRPWVDTVNTSLTKTGHIIQYEPDMYFGIDWQVLDVIKHPPNFMPSASYSDDITRTVTALKKELYQFKYRWTYDDNEKSVFSSTSKIPIPTYAETVFGGYAPEYQNKDNVINVWVNTGSSEVKEVEIAVRRGNIGDWGIVKRIYKYDENGNCVLSADINTLFQFYNTESIEYLVQEDANRYCDFVPLYAHGQELIEKNRLSYQRYAEGFNNLSIDVSNIQQGLRFISSILPPWFLMLIGYSHPDLIQQKEIL